MLLEFPEDPTAAYCDRQYMLGENLLVAPVFSESGEVTFYVPDGIWTHLVTGEELRGPRWVTQKHGFDSLPLLVRPGSVIPVGAVTSRPDYAWADGVTLRPFGLQPGSVTTVRIPSPDGGEASVFEVSSTDDGAQVELVSGSSTAWSVG
jgi:alpha-D-xyloside xylohydrolase